MIHSVESECMKGKNNKGIVMMSVELRGRCMDAFFAVWWRCKTCIATTLRLTACASRPVCPSTIVLKSVSINRKKLPQNPASVFLKHIVRNWPNPGRIFYVPVFMSRNPTVHLPVPSHHQLPLRTSSKLEMLNWHLRLLRMPPT